MTQAQLAGMAYGQRMKEREVKRMCDDVRQWVDDGYDVPRELRDAIKLTPVVLALPAHYKRFELLYGGTYADLFV